MKIKHLEEIIFKRSGVANAALRGSVVVKPCRDAINRVSTFCRKMAK